MDKSNNIHSIDSTIVAEAFIRVMGGMFLDENNIIWKIINGELIGKRSVWTHDNRGVWLEDLGDSKIKREWCGENSDYDEIFRKSK